MQENRIKDKHQEHKDTAKQQTNSRSHNDRRTYREEVTKFTYLGAKVTKDSNSESEGKARIDKARGAFAALKNNWKTNKITNRTEIHLFKNNVLSVLPMPQNHGRLPKAYVRC